MAMGNAGAYRLRAVRGYPPHASLAPDGRASPRTMTTTSLFVSCKYLHASWHQHFLLSGYQSIARIVILELSCRNSEPWMGQRWISVSLSQRWRLGS